MRYILSRHAIQELERRAIPYSILEAVLGLPQQIVSARDGIECFQSQADISGKMYLIRVMVNVSTVPPTVVTVYRTTKIGKYWGRT